MKAFLKGKTVNHLRILTADLAHLLPIDICRADADLDELIGAWDGLTESVRAGILAVARATRERRDVSSAKRQG